MRAGEPTRRFAIYRERQLARPDEAEIVIAGKSSSCSRGDPLPVSRRGVFRDRGARLRAIKS